MLMEAHGGRVGPVQMEMCHYQLTSVKISTVIQQLTIRLKCNCYFVNILQLFKMENNIKICLKSNRTDIQNVEFIELFLTEIQVKH